jgi:hypothetical protein
MARVKQYDGQLFYGTERLQLHLGIGGLRVLGCP